MNARTRRRYPSSHVPLGRSGEALGGLGDIRAACNARLAANGLRPDELNRPRAKHAAR